MVDKKLNTGTVIIAVALTVVVMSGIFFLGTQLSQEKGTGIQRQIDSFETERRSQELSRRLASDVLTEKSCDALNIAVEQTVDDVQDLGDDVQRYEENAKIGLDQVNELKMEYTNSLIDYWLLVEEVDDLCGTDTVRLLYFYSDDYSCPDCGDQGAVLSHYREVYDGDLLVFPLDATLDMRHTNILLETYEIEEFPSMKINGEIYQGFRDKEEMGEILEDYMD